MSNQQQSEKIKAWINKTGYPLEMAAASILRKYKFNTLPSFLYKDFETEKTREIDLFCQGYVDNDNARISVELNYVIECKKSDKPIILLTNDKINDLDKFNLLDHFTSPKYNEDTFAFFKYSQFKEKKSKKYIPTGYKIIQAFSDTDQHLIGGLNSLSKATEYFNTQLIDYEYEKMIIEDNLHIISSSILLTDADIFWGVLDSKKEIVLKPIKIGVLLYRLPWGAENELKLNIPIVSIKNFESFIKSNQLYCKRFINFLKKNPNANVIAMKKKYKSKKVPTKR